AVPLPLLRVVAARVPLLRPSDGHGGPLPLAGCRNCMLPIRTSQTIRLSSNALVHDGAIPSLAALLLLHGYLHHAAPVRLQNLLPTRPLSSPPPSHSPLLQSLRGSCCASSSSPSWPSSPSCSSCSSCSFCAGF